MGNSLPSRNYRVQQAKQERTFNVAISNLFTNPTRDAIINLKKAMGDTCCGFVSNLEEISMGRKKEVPNDFKGIEYEVKLGIDLKEDTLVNNYLNFFTAQGDVIFNVSGKYFLINDSIFVRSSANDYYGNDSDESLVVMRNGDQRSLKTKGCGEPVSLGVADDQFVVKRKERVLRERSERDVARAVQDTILKSNRYRGQIDRDRRRVDFISLDNGRFYSMVCDVCNVYSEPKGNLVKRQLEVEYIGYLLEQFEGFERGSEIQMVSDLLSLGNLAKKVVCSKNSNVSSMDFTTERKYDFFTK